LCYIANPENRKSISAIRVSQKRSCTAQANDAQAQESFSQTRRKCPPAREHARQSCGHNHQYLEDSPADRCSKTAHIGCTHSIQCKRSHPKACHEDGPEYIGADRLKECLGPVPSQKVDAASDIGKKTASQPHWPNCPEVEGSGPRPPLKPDPIVFCSFCSGQEAEEHGSGRAS
jgi:hypothetical protein